MSISSLGSCSSTQTQATQYRSTATSSSGTGAAQGPGKARGDDFVSAIASALSELGASTTDASTGTDSTDPAQALGDFLQQLMDTLHAQGGQGAQSGQEAGAPPPPPPPGGGGGGGGIQADLQSLIASLSGDSSGDGTDSTTALQSSFSSLLGSLGVDDTGASAKLGQFLQTLASKLEASGPSGNLINTSA